MTEEQISTMVEGMCMTWRHDFGLDKPEASGDWFDSIMSGMTDLERDALRSNMRQLVEHHFLPALQAASAAPMVHYGPPAEVVPCGTHKGPPAPIVPLASAAPAQEPKAADKVFLSELASTEQTMRLEGFPSDAERIRRAIELLTATHPA